MLNISNKSNAILDAYDKGYRAIDGKIFYKERERILIKNANGYFCFSIKCYNKKQGNVPVHRLIAYQKYGNVIFEKGIHVRHLDNNPLNNSEDNIVIGNQSENMMDKPKELRMRCAIYATSFMKKYNHDEIIEFYNLGNSYKDIMKKYNISSKGAVSFIIKQSISSK